MVHRLLWLAMIKRVSESGQGGRELVARRHYLMGTNRKEVSHDGKDTHETPRLGGQHVVERNSGRWTQRSQQDKDTQQTLLGTLSIK